MMTYYGLHKGKWHEIGNFDSLSSAKRGNNYFDQIATRDEMFSIPSVKMALTIEYSILIAGLVLLISVGILIFR